MGRERRLLTGPQGPTLVAALIADEPQDRKELWLVPSPLARDRLTRDLARLHDGPCRATVWTWDDLWPELRLRHGGGPALPSPAALRSILNQAISRADGEGRLRALKDAIQSPGFRRPLRTRLASWTRAGLDPTEPPPGAGEVTRAEWAIFAKYRRLLATLGVEDPEGFELSAARKFHGAPLKGLGEFQRVVLIEPASSPSVQFVVDAVQQHADSVTVALTYDSRPSRQEIYSDASALRDRLLGWGFLEEIVPASTARSSAIDTLSRELFQHTPELRTDDARGLTILHAPEGEGEALLVARHVRQLLESGADPDQIIVGVPGRDERASLIVDVMNSWTIPTAVDFPVRLATQSSVSALRLAMTLPVLDCDADAVVSLLRNGRVRPGWPEAARPLSLATAATAVRESRAYRGADAIRDAMRRNAVPREDDDEARTISRRRRATRALEALPIFACLVATLKIAARPGTWPIQVDRLFQLAESLGIELDRPLDALRLALDDQGEVLSRLGHDEEVWSWSAFAAEVGAAIDDTTMPHDPAIRVGVRVTTFDQLQGVSARHLILANLAEGSLPSRSALETEAGAEPGGFERASRREMNRFLRLVNVPGESLTLSSPTTDEKGQRLLSAGFLDDVRALFTPVSLECVTHSLARLPGVLPQDLAVAPAELRVRAVAMACGEEILGPLRALSRIASHRGPLEGTARALRLAHWRTRRTRFHRFDGRLADPRILERLAAEFGASRRPFSASQLESLALCPFQFYQRYVLCLEPPDEREEMADDYAYRGSLLHGALEQLHANLRDVPSQGEDTIADRIERGIEGTFDRILASQVEPTSEIDRGLLEIETERMRRTARKYARQYRAYEGSAGIGASCKHLEVAFGGNRARYPALELGEPPNVLKILGVIDRIDVVNGDDTSHFRVIDYKTGSPPPNHEIETGLSLQLPLYAMAAERIIFAEERTAPLDAAYWSLKEKGFKTGRLMTKSGAEVAKVEGAWRTFEIGLETYILALVARIRSGDFPVHPRKHDCGRYCDYRFVCRITESRRGTKVWPDSPSLGS